MRSVKKVERIYPTKDSKEKTPDFMLGSHERQTETFKKLLEAKKIEASKKQPPKVTKAHYRRDTLELSSEGMQQLYNATKKDTS